MSATLLSPSSRADPWRRRSANICRRTRWRPCRTPLPPSVLRVLCTRWEPLCGYYLRTGASTARIAPTVQGI
eukprot:2217947-Pleurochrysis_carterae.AAC.11